jgi:glycerophosphoryl diester phosphodiesterase
MKGTGVAVRSLAALVALGTMALWACSSPPAPNRRASPTLRAQPAGPVRSTPQPTESAPSTPPPTQPVRPTSAGPVRPTPPARRLRVLAHRGGIERAHENTMASFNDAIAIGADYVETDVRHSADGVAFLMHDPALPQACGPYAGNQVRSLTAAQLAQVRCAGQPVPRLDDLVARLRRPDAARTALFPEIKDGDALGVRDAVAPLGWSRVIVQSSDYDALRQIKQASSEVPTCPLMWSADQLDSALSVSHDCIAPEYHLVNAGLVARAHAVGAMVFPFTVDQPDVMRSLAAMGCDGVITNRPRAAFAVLR